MTRSSFEPGTDAWANHDARRLLSVLADRGVSVTVKGGRLDVRPASRLLRGEELEIRRHRLDLLLLVLACDERTLDRLLILRRTAVRGTPRSRPPNVDRRRCYSCGDMVPPSRRMNRCGWCALAGRLYAGAPLTHDLLELFDEELVGHQARYAVTKGHAALGRFDLDGAA